MPIQTVWELEHGHRKFVSFPMKNCDFQELCQIVNLPEGKSIHVDIWLVQGNPVTISLVPNLYIPILEGWVI